MKNSHTYNEDEKLRGYVITLQNFEKWLKEGQRIGLVTITEKTIDISEDDSKTSNEEESNEKH